MLKNTTNFGKFTEYHNENERRSFHDLRISAIVKGTRKLFKIILQEHNELLR